MKRFILRFLFLYLSTLSILYSSEYVVVTSSDIKELSIGEIRAIYLKKTFFADDVKVVPINLDLRNDIRKSFEKKVLKMSLRRLKSYWTQQHYLGNRPPISMTSQRSIKVFLKKVSGSIGYISIDKLDNNLQILYKWEE